VIPSYFESKSTREWIRMAKASMRTIIPRFNAERMVRQYVENLYCPAAGQNRRLGRDRGSERLAQWKQRIAEHWPGVRLERTDTPRPQVKHGETIVVELQAQLGALQSGDVHVECVVTRDNGESRTFSAVDVGPTTDHRTGFRLEFAPPFAGQQTYQIRMYPHHDLLSHPFEMGRMLWI
jgi:glycogen phosphorylase